MAEGQGNVAKAQLVKGSGCGTREWREDFQLTDSAGAALFSVAKDDGDTTVAGNLDVTGTVTANAVVDGAGAVALSSTLSVAGATTLHAVAATTVAASGLITSTVAAGSPVLKLALTTDTPTVAFGVDASHNPSTAPAGYVEIVVGTTPYYFPVWA